MNLKRLKNRLEESFGKTPSNGRSRHIIFWYDEEGEFAQDIDELGLDNAKILKIESNNAFYIKYKLEKEDSTSNYLLYSSMAKPLPQDNWLLDILKYSIEFSADRAVMLMQDFGISDYSLRNVFKRYLGFFADNVRRRKFTSYGITDFTEEEVDIAVLSALCNLSVNDFEEVVKKVLLEDLEENRYLKDISKYADLDVFWGLLENRYAYKDKEQSLEKLAITLLTSHLNFNLKAELPDTWQEYLSDKKANCYVFVNNFMHYSTNGKEYSPLADGIERKLNVKRYVADWDIDKYIDCDTFKVFDWEIICNLIKNLLADIGEFNKYREIIKEREKSYWYHLYHSEYEALNFALEFLAMEKGMQGIIRGQSAQELVDLYTKEYYLMDYFYRKFYYYYDSIVNKEPFAQLVEIIENTYTNWFLNQLSVKWSQAVGEEMLAEFPLPQVSQQQNFYQDFVSPFVVKDERVFVIISDALRYEAAKELVELINREVRGRAEMKFMQGVVPSTTKYGMASLLPGKEIRLNEKNEVLVDNINTQGTENRGKILANHSDASLAITYKDMIDMKRADYKETFEGKRLIYIYHNAIDAIGDTAATEREVFTATEKAFQELVLLLKNLINNISATNIIITADHGFIYERSPLTEIDKISRYDVKALEIGRRYILLDSNQDFPDALPIAMNYLLGENTGLIAVVPKAVIRYKIQGAGVNYVHGGVSLQEIIVPVIKFKNIRRSEYKPTKVEVKLTNISRKITNRITYLEFFQRDLAQDKKIPLRLKLYFVDEDGNRISNENIIIADSKAEKPAARTYREKFTLKDIAYDKTRNYYLILEDEEETVEKIYDKIPFTIDLLFSDDFGF